MFSALESCKRYLKNTENENIEEGLVQNSPQRLKFNNLLNPLNQTGKYDSYLIFLPIK